MKKAILMLSLVTGIITSSLAAEWADRNAVPATKGSIEQFAIDYLKLFIAGDEEAILKLCEPKLKSHFSEENRTYLKSRIKWIKGANLKKKLKQRTNPEVDGVIKIEMTTKNAKGRNAGFDIKVKRAGESFLVLMD